jgi:hypothetical protein
MSTGYHGTNVSGRCAISRYMLHAVPELVAQLHAVRKLGSFQGLIRAWQRGFGGSRYLQLDCAHKLKT